MKTILQVKQLANWVLWWGKLEIIHELQIRRAPILSFLLVTTPIVSFSVEFSFLFYFFVSEEGMRDLIYLIYTNGTLGTFFLFRYFVYLLNWNDYNNVARCFVINKEMSRGLSVIDWSLNGYKATVQSEQKTETRKVCSFVYRSVVWLYFYFHPKFDWTY